MLRLAARLCKASTITFVSILQGGGGIGLIISLLEQTSGVALEPSTKQQGLLLPYN